MALQVPLPNVSDENMKLLTLEVIENVFMIVRSSNLTTLGFVGILGAAAFLIMTWNHWQRRRRHKTDDDPRQYDDSLFVDPNEPMAEEEQPLDDPLRYLQQDKWKLDESLEQFIRNLPKVELHVHLDGSFDTDVMWNYLQEKEQLWCLPVTTTLPWDQSIFPVRQLVQDCQSADDFRKLCTCRGQRSLQEMIKCFEIFLPVVRGNLEFLEEMAYDFCRRQAQQRVIYTEVRYSPHLLAEGAQLNAETNEPTSSSDNASSTTETSDIHTMAHEQLLERAELVLQAITQGLRRGSVDFEITINQILCAITWRPDWALHVVDLAGKYRQNMPCGVVGVDIAAGEEHFDQEQFPHLFQPHYDMMQRAKSLGIPITLHAGEVGLAENVSRAVQEYGATRIGHGYRMQAATRALLKERDIHVEVCPTSSAETGGWDYTTPTSDDDPQHRKWHEHPVVDMLRDGLSVSINSDDPAVFDTSLCWQYRILLGKAGLEKDDVVTMTRNAIQAAFCSNEEKERLLQSLDEYLNLPDADSGSAFQQPPPALRKASFQDRVRSHPSL